jgi:hypothetical protein
MADLKRRLDRLQPTKATHTDPVTCIFIISDDEPVLGWQCGDQVIYREPGESCYALQERAAAATDKNVVSILYPVDQD